MLLDGRKMMAISLTKQNRIEIDNEIQFNLNINDMSVRKRWNNAKQQYQAYPRIYWEKQHNTRNYVWLLIP